MMATNAAKFLSGLLSLCVFVSSTDWLWSQTTRSGVSGSATESINVKPDRIRLTMWMKAQATDSDEALKQLSEHRDRIRKELELLKADMSSVIFSDPRVTIFSVDSRSRTQQIQFQIQNRLNGNAQPKQIELPPLFDAFCALKADWQLPDSTPEVLGKLQMNLKDQINKRDFLGLKNKPTLNDEQEKYLSSFENSNSNTFVISSGDNGNTLASPPRIVFIARITPEMRKQVAQAAFKKATEQVDILCAAAGGKRGKLLSTAGSSPFSLPSSSMQAYSTSEGIVSRSSRTFPMALLLDEQSLVVGTSYDDLVFSGSVSVNYDIEE